MATNINAANEWTRYQRQLAYCGMVHDCPGYVRTLFSMLHHAADVDNVEVINSLPLT